MSNILEKLKEYFQNTPRSKVLEDWENAKNKVPNVPTLQKYINHLEIMIAKEKLHYSWLLSNNANTKESKKRLDYYELKLKQYKKWQN